MWLAFSQTAIKTREVENSMKPYTSKPAHWFRCVFLSVFLVTECWSSTATTPGQVTCVTFDGVEIVVPPEQVNDDYCDCPLSGLDEPNTSACAGSRHWPGRTVDPDQESPLLFACPQQPDLKLSLSKLNDGICDCCDGADEAQNENIECPDDCAAALAEARRRRQALQDGYTAGAKKRQEELQEYNDFVEESKSTIAANEAELTTKQKLLEEANKALTAAKIQWMQSRLHSFDVRVKEVFTDKRPHSSLLPDLRELLHPLTTAELRNLVIHACQMAGEMSKASKHNTCVPLRLAGLATGIVWEPDTYKVVKISNDETALASWADVVHANLENPQEPKWQLSQVREPSKKRHRRLDEVLDDDYMGAYDDAIYDYGKDEDDFEDGYGMDDEDFVEEESVNMETQTTWVKDQPFSAPRIGFLTATDALIAKIEEALKLAKGATNEADEDGAPIHTEPAKDFDPMTAPLIRGQLQNRRKAIESGFTYAGSARVLIQEMEDRDTLRSLLFGVWYFGQLSAWQMWQVYQSVVPELGGKTEENQSCQVVWGCPPVAATRKVGRDSVVMPPAFFVEVVDDYCREMAVKDIDPSQVCVSGDIEIPGSVTDGMYGYYSVLPREDNDTASIMFRGLDSEDFSGEQNQLLELMLSSESLQKEVSGLKSAISNEREKLGANEDGSSKYGDDGELYKLKDSCFEITAGKYTYELCLFQSATQKEGASRGGTNLGSWSGPSLTDDGKRVWSWENGAKCWNGPKRSAWANLTCGETTRIVSADEPETCKYVFEVESHIACDDQYRSIHGLS